MILEAKGRPLRRRVRLLHVGGTIGSVPTPAGLRPESGFLERYIASMPELQHPSMPTVEVRALEPLLDSADMQPLDWVRIAHAIAEDDAAYDGFVVLHGTDTMAYTASALSFLFQGLGKPVVMTGSQLSLGEVRSDGREHIITALLIAGTLPIPEVTLYFGARLLRGNRSQKVRNRDFVAFESGNLPPLATVGVGIDVAWQAVLPPGRGRLRVPELVREPNVASLRIFPGITASMLGRMLDAPVDAVVLETYGAGNFPARRKELLTVVREAVDRGVVVVNCSQCHTGRVSQDVYETGRSLAEAGAVSGADLTPEAALTKLYCLLAEGHPADEVRRLTGRPLAGEMSP